MYMAFLITSSYYKIEEKKKLAIAELLGIYLFASIFIKL